MDPVVCVFGFKRPEHLELTLRSLSRNFLANQLDLRVYIDGASAPDEQCNILSSAAVAHRSTGFRSVEVILSAQNKGLYNSITEGLADAFRFSDTVIVLEDDMITSKYFLSYMIDGLRCYQDIDEVASIQAFNPVRHDYQCDTFFLPGTDCWGWATWKHKWNLFRNDALKMHEQIVAEGLCSRFNLNGSYDYTALLKDTGEGKTNSWAICWHASTFLAGKVSLYPCRSLVRNIGLDGSGEHCGPSDFLNCTVSDAPINVRQQEATVNEHCFQLLSSHFKNSLARRINVKTRSLRRLLLNATILIIKLFKKDTLNLRGPYKTFDSANEYSSGYSDNSVIAKVLEATLGLLDGNGNYERDGTLFMFRDSRCMVRKFIRQCPFEYPNVLDVGGGLGATYLNNIDMSDRFGSYMVLETEAMSTAGRNVARRYKLPISYITGLHQVCKPLNVVIFSSVLQYLEDPTEMLEHVIRLRPQIILIDRTPFHKDSFNGIWIQIVNDYYRNNVSYPIWIFGETLLKLLSNNSYELVESWTSPFDHEIPCHKGFLFRNIL